MDSDLSTAWHNQPLYWVGVIHVGNFINYQHLSLTTILAVSITITIIIIIIIIIIIN